MLILFLFGAWERTFQQRKEAYAMKLFDRNFFIGFAAGAGLVGLLIFGISFGLLWWVGQFGDHGAAGFALSAPPVPAAGADASGPEAPLDWAVETLDGEAVSLSDCEGEVVFLNIWATWCGPCRAEMPGIQALYNQLKDQGVRFVCVTEEEAPAVKTFLVKAGYTFPIYRTGEKLPPAFATDGIPATFIIDRAGAIVFQHIGSAKWDDEACVRFLQGLIALPSPGR